MKAIRLTVSEISSGNETWSQGHPAARPDMVMTISPAPTSWAGDKNTKFVDFKSTHMSIWHKKSSVLLYIFLFDGQIKRLKMDIDAIIICVNCSTEIIWL